MIRDTEFSVKPETAFETSLWRGVIARTIHDWLSTSLRLRLEAEQYLFQNSKDLSLVCESAGLNVEHLRKRLNRVRGRTLDDVLQLAA